MCPEKFLLLSHAHCVSHKIVCQGCKLCNQQIDLLSDVLYHGGPIKRYLSRQILIKYSNQLFHKSAV